MPRKLVWGTVVVILATAVVAGPLVPGANISMDSRAEDRLHCGPNGSANVSVGDVPVDGFSLDRQRFGVETYRLSIPEIPATVETFDGCPVVIYELEVPDLDYVTVSRYYPTDHGGTSLTLSIVGGTFEPDRIANDSYEATISVHVEGDERRTVYRQNVTVPVIE